MKKKPEVLNGTVISVDTDKLLLVMIDGSTIPTVVQYNKGTFTVGQKINVEHRGSYHVQDMSESKAVPGCKAGFTEDELIAFGLQELDVFKTRELMRHLAEANCYACVRVCAEYAVIRTAYKKVAKPGQNRRER